jgi:hypothetical protein
MIGSWTAATRPQPAILDGARAQADQPTGLQPHATIPRPFRRGS